MFSLKVITQPKRLLSAKQLLGLLNLRIKLVDFFPGKQHVWESQEEARNVKWSSGMSKKLVTWSKQTHSVLASQGC